jgi:hypothetical protein
VGARATAAGSNLDREWWLRTLAVFVSPRPVFAALRDESDESVGARQEPILLLVLMASAATIMVFPWTGRLMDPVRDGVYLLPQDRDGVLAAVGVFIAAIMYGFATYLIGGGAVYWGMRAAGSKGRWRRARHILAFAAAPLALSLVTLWPVEIAVFGGDLFRTGGSDTGAARAVFDALEGVFFLWSFGLLVYGVSAVEDWKIVRAIGALVLGSFVLLGLALLPFLVV